MIKTCPSDDVLLQFNDGRIDNLAEIDQITEHLGICEVCIDKLESMEPGPIAEGLRQSVSNRLIADETGAREQDLDSVRGSFDELISNVDPLFADPYMDSSELGENRFEVIATIGEGDFSCVYGALNDDRGIADTSVELVAIKIPHAHKLTTGLHRQQFINDCRKAMRLQHSGIQRILEFGQWDEKRWFLSQPLLQHPTLTRFARGAARLDHDSMLSIFKQLVDAVYYAHQRNVIHRHLNPNNIHFVLPSESELGETVHPKPEIRVLISDFGFVLDSRYHFDLIESASSKTPFSSPESTVLNAGFIDERTDIYSLGKILKLLKHITTDPRNGDQIGKIIENSTFVRRRDRYQTVSELKSAVEMIE